MCRWIGRPMADLAQAALPHKSDRSGLTVTDSTDLVLCQNSKLDSDMYLPLCLP